MKGEFKPESYKDEYREALVAVIEAKAEGKRIEAPKPSEQPTKIADLMSVLEASVAAAREARSGSGPAATKAKAGSGKVADIKTAAKRSTAKSTTAAKAEPKQERRRKTA